MTPVAEVLPAVIAPPTVAEADRKLWLKARKSGVGASEVAAILGVDPRRGQLAVFADKVADDLSEEDKDWLAFGRDVEGAIGKLYHRRTERPVFTPPAFTIQKHESAPLFATLDFETEGNEKHPAPAPGRGPLEAKAVMAAKKDEWIADPPLHFVVQLQMQMAVTGAQWGALCALIGGIVPAYVDIPRNQRFIDHALVAVDAFWKRVEAGDPPPPDAKPGTIAALRALYPKDTGIEIELPADHYVLVREWEAAKAEAKKHDEAAALAAAKLQAVMRDATWARLPDGTYLKWKTEERKGHVVGPSSPRVFRHVKSR